MASKSILFIIVALLSCIGICYGAKPSAQCNLPVKRGNCDNVQEQWAYNPATNVCEPFQYSGCKGNDNRFKNQKECNKACGVSSSLLSVLPFGGKSSKGACTGDAEPGTCRGSAASAPVERFMYNSRSKHCEKFTWSGCGGNANNYISRTACRKACRK